jgi:hypothetical protein
MLERLKKKVKEKLKRKTARQASRSLSINPSGITGPKTSLPDHDVESGSAQEDAAPSLPPSALLSVLSSWPAKLCFTCATMTGTMDGLRDLMSRDGYRHHKRHSLEVSMSWGCDFCALLFNIVCFGSDGGIWHVEHIDGEELDTEYPFYFEECGPEDTITVSCQSKDGLLFEAHILDQPSILLRYLFVGWISTRGDVHFNYSLKYWHTNRLRAFTDAQNDRYSISLAFNGEFPAYVCDQTDQF